MNQTEMNHFSSAGVSEIKPGAFIDVGVTLDAGVTVGPNAVILSTDESTGLAKPTRVRAGSIIGANATVLPGVTVGEKAYVKAGSVVTRSIPPLAIVEGNPAIITGYRGTHPDATKEQLETAAVDGGRADSSKVAGVTFHRLKFVSDLRGNLSVAEFQREIPFDPKRYFVVFDVPTAETRGEHAHRTCEQFLICVKGACSVVADDGSVRQEFVLDAPNKGLYLRPMVWGIQYKYSLDAVLLVFASHAYDPEDYIRDYNEFLSLVVTAR